MLADLWPLYRLALVTPRLELRLPREDELAALAVLAGRGVHPPGERPFLTPWTDGGPEDRARSVLRGHWQRLAAWDEAAWALGLGVFRRGSGEPIGLVAAWASDFAVVREVATWSWLGLEFHSRGYGTEARAALLTLAFDHLGASAALSAVFRDNHASQAVSRKLGYAHDGITVDARDGEALVSDRLRLTADRWRTVDHPAVTVTGLAACRSWFGL
ncbi:RimJ/RimL family protein N-acetyltransferase [Catenuloplanes nepalensis]|uniref:RimJ/RimL family protein N-acetyltransferase n=1 Tax=Catenuloplanes nepalensis TaxID=587533 RepID=A0ABT9MSW7_9ACTN|nr:GNAT family N-acetyltransferase [Catenuloplanes nepalensis]MDP9794544.1 RimJ/RimL family protein N-acetyltransferase [Catenuloplanes nepalensis]